MICKKCGTLNIAEAVECSQCGSRLGRMTGSNNLFKRNNPQNHLSETTDPTHSTANKKNSAEQYESASDWEKINILWQDKTEELQKNWKYPAFKNKTLIKLIALILLFIPAVSLLMFHFVWQIASHTEIELPQIAAPKPNPMQVEFHQNMEAEYIQQQLTIMKQLQTRVEQYYQSQNKLPTLVDAELQQFIAKQLPKHQPNGIPTMLGDVSIREGLIESHTQRNFLMDHKNTDDIQIFMIPQVDQAKQLKWQCKVIGVTVAVQGCERIEIHP